MIARTISPRLQKMMSKYPIIGILGPRQSGKTTLARSHFPALGYVSLESPDNREYATKDPRGFLETHKPPVILDEIQKTPELFSYIQEKVDISGKTGQYIITGSQNFTLNEKISQTLAGRIYLAHLPTFTLSELSGANMETGHWQEYAHKGTSPRVWDKDLAPTEWYPSYVQTYLERDVRDMKNISDLRDFQTFLRLCAGRAGQSLVLSSLSNELGVSHNTVKSWISVLEASYLIFLLKPYYKNMKKRLVKSPKLFFLDTGMMTHLLNITDANQIETHPLKGSIFENLVISEIIKTQINSGKTDLGYYIRDKSGNEVDYVTERSGSLSFTEIKASKTFHVDYLKGINYWNKIFGSTTNDRHLIYSGDEERVMNGTQILRWNNAKSLLTL